MATRTHSPHAHHWTLDPGVVFLNHGSFGACPAAVLAYQQELRARIEREPVDFLVRKLPGLYDAARERLGAFLGADPERIAFVSNATEGVNTVVAALPLRPGDELLTTDHEYNACRAALVAAAERSGARVVAAAVPFPIASADDVVAAVVRALTPRTRFALVDHVTSQTGLVFPAERLVAELSARGVPVMVDGAHAPGMVPLNLELLGADWYTGNAHKWLCAPKGAAFLWARHDRAAALRPLVTSHGHDAPLGGRTRLRVTFDWTGTRDPTPWLCIPESIAFLERLLPGGVAALMAANRELALAARALLCEALGIAEPAPASMIGALAALPLDAPRGDGPFAGLAGDPAATVLFERHAIEAPFMIGPGGRTLIRVAAQAYNTLDDYRPLAAALRDEW